MAKILMVDDDADLNSASQTLLEERGHEVRVARSVKEAEEILKTSKPDVVVLDVIMETRTAGFELVRKLDEVAPEIPAILVSAMREQGSFRFTPDENWLPIVDFLEKPVPPMLLAETIEDVLAN